MRAARNGAHGRRRASTGGRGGMADLHVPGMLGDGECTMSRGVWAVQLRENMEDIERRWAPPALAFPPAEVYCWRDSLGGRRQVSFSLKEA
jgi:hypothetical protein